MHVDAAVSRASDYAIVTISLLVFVLSLEAGRVQGRWEKKQGEMGENVRRTDLEEKKVKRARKRKLSDRSHSHLYMPKQA